MKTVKEKKVGKIDYSDFLSPYKRRMIEKEKAVYEDYKKMIEDAPTGVIDRGMKSVIMEHIAQKHNLYDRTSVYRIVNKIRLRKQASQLEL